MKTQWLKAARYLINVLICQILQYKIWKSFIVIFSPLLDYLITLRSRPRLHGDWSIEDDDVAIPCEHLLL